MEDLSTTTSVLITVGAVPITAFVTWLIAAKRIVIENVNSRTSEVAEKSTGEGIARPRCYD